MEGLKIEADGSRFLSRKKPTMDDVAELAKVCKATVSMVMSHDSRISAKTRQKVLEAVDSLNYKVNETARALSLRRTEKRTAASLSSGSFVPWANKKVKEESSQLMPDRPLSTVVIQP